MRHLCTACAGLHASQPQSGSGAKALHSASELNYESISSLATSAQGLTGKPCHFCALLLRSLKSHETIGTQEEFTSLPSDPIQISLAESDNGAFSIIAKCGARIGQPIELSLDTDESCRGSEVSSSASSDQVFSQIQSWSLDCVTKHVRCSIARSPVSWLPSRVIDLGSEGNAALPKIYESKGAVGRYVTLTHRWTSRTKDSATTLGNYELRKNSIDVQSLSSTFQDALEATRKLGVRYIWIDAICMQDSDEDWAREASNMRSIYEFAWLNIAGAGSETESGRLFMERVSRLSRPCKLPVSVLSQQEDVQGPLYAYLSSDFYAKAVFDGFLTRRGWILQERILSPRTVYFGQEEVFWECSTMTASETVPWGWSDNNTPLVKFNSHDLALNPSGLLDDVIVRSQPLNERPLKIRKKSDNPETGGDVSPSFAYWYKLVESYTCKDLTKSADRLPAIYGLAQALHKSAMPHKSFADSYNNGVWLSEPASLLWYSDKIGSGDALDEVPSYSWARCNGPVEFLTGEKLFSGDNNQSFEISLPNTETLFAGPRLTRKRNLLKVNGPLKLAKITITDANQKDDYGIINSGPKPRISITTDTSHASYAVLLDNHRDPSLVDWLEFSRDSVWFLRLATGKLNPRAPARVEWTNKADQLDDGGLPQYFSHSLHVRHFGLLLVPIAEDIAMVKEMQEKLETWNLPAEPKLFARIRSGRESSPPLYDNRKHFMAAKSRLNVSTLMGPHNTIFRRIGIFQGGLEDFYNVTDSETAVFLA